MNEYVRVGIAAKLMGVCPETIRRWEKDGKITCIRTVGGHRRIALIEITRLLTGEESDETPRKMAVYARVSSHDQKKKGHIFGGFSGFCDSTCQSPHPWASLRENIGEGT